MADVKKSAVVTLEELSVDAPELFGVPTGTRLDSLFWTVAKEGDQFVKKSIGGIPYGGVLNITGVPDTGKSILGEQFALFQAGREYNVLFVTVETPAPFLYTSFEAKSMALGLDFETVKKHLTILDASSNEVLREDVKAFLDTLEYAIREKHTSIVVIDSITGLYEHKEVMARQIVRVVYQVLKKYRQTSLIISQKRSSQASDSAEAAGGLAVAHIADGSIVMDKKIIESSREGSVYNLPIGSVLRTIRIDGCRLCGHDSRVWVFELTEGGLINLVAPLEDYIKRR